MKPSKTLFSIALMVVMLTGSIYFLKNFSLTWVEVQQDKAIITVNFLFPMAKENLAQCIKIQPQISSAQDFKCTIRWLSDKTAQITLEECSTIKGQKVRLIINNAPDRTRKVRKNAEMSIQFRSPISILSPQEELLIGTKTPFIIHFNTPMKKSMLHKYLESDAHFYIEPVKRELPNGKEEIDPTTYAFIPKEKLENSKKYVLSFRKGMPSESGVMLQEDTNVLLYTDSKPNITSLIPPTGSKWIGLFPKISLETDKPITEAYIELDGKTFKGKQITAYKAEFFPESLLKPETTYALKAKVKAPSGEMSEMKQTLFTTVPVHEDRIWVEIILNPTKSSLVVYKGEKQLKKMLCSGGKKETPTPYGTFYTYEKGEKYYSHKDNEGANSWIMLSEGIIIQGITRDEYWKIKNNIAQHLGEAQTKGNIILSEEDALWLYSALPNDTMVIIHD